MFKKITFFITKFASVILYNFAFSYRHHFHHKQIANNWRNNGINEYGGTIGGRTAGLL
jgi:hypothetical protein